MSKTGERLFVWFQYVLPKRGLSRLILSATRVRTPWFKNALVRGFMKLFAIDMTEAIDSDPFSYGSFNEFFTRALKPGLRAIAGASDAIACPVDGVVSEAGIIEGNMLLQAKGMGYRLADLLAGEAFAQRFEGGCFVTIYLAPFDYHRVHMPLDARLRDTIFVPGDLFSVNSATARHVPRLFARNERVITCFDTAHGQCVVVLVGALNVGSMSTVWSGDIMPAGRRAPTKLPPQDVTLAKGAELGRFNMGSTVILLFEPNHARWLPHVRAGTVVRLGEPLGTLQ